MSTVQIYGLYDPRDNSLRYVGKTCASLAKRLMQHVSDARRRKFEGLPRFRWIRKLSDIGLSPDIRLLTVSSSDRWREDEQCHIAKAKSDGCNLLNATAGGDGIHGHKHSEETKRKQSESAFKRFSDPDSRKRLSECVKRGMATEDARAKLRANARKKFESTEYREACTKRIVEQSRSAEGRSNRSAMRKGVVVSQEVRAKIGAANTGKRRTDEQKLQMSLARTGRKHSEETRRKIGESLRALRIA